MQQQATHQLQYPPHPTQRQQLRNKYRHLRRLQPTNTYNKQRYTTNIFPPVRQQPPRRQPRNRTNVRNPYRKAPTPNYPQQLRSNPSKTKHTNLHTRQYPTLHTIPTNPPLHHPYHQSNSRPTPRDNPRNPPRQTNSTNTHPRPKKHPTPTAAQGKSTNKPITTNTLKKQVSLHQQNPHPPNDTKHHLRPQYHRDPPPNPTRLRPRQITRKQLSLRNETPAHPHQLHLNRPKATKDHMRPTQYIRNMPRATNHYVLAFFIRISRGLQVNDYGFFTFQMWCSWHSVSAQCPRKQFRNPPQGKPPQRGKYSKPVIPARGEDILGL